MDGQSCTVVCHHGEWTNLIWLRCWCKVVSVSRKQLLGAPACQYMPIVHLWMCCRLLFAFPRNAVRFTVFENVISFADDRSLPHVQMLSGMAAGAIEAPLCLVPMQNISIKMTHDANKPPGQQRFPRFFQGVALISREEGIRGLMLKGMSG